MKSCDDLHDEEQSGDDIFLLQSVKKRGGVIRFLKSEAAFVHTKPAENLSEFINQRRRWASKSPLYTDWQIVFVAVLVFSMALVELLLMYNALTDLKFLIVFGSFFIAKLIFDSIFLQLVHGFFHLSTIWMETVLLSVFYPFYIVFVAISALVFKPKSWK
jgi:cellulose synthase/poly-beta-1,6-N-acetylglucosamine synthase-like glycosyltransferase